MQRKRFYVGIAADTSRHVFLASRHDCAGFPHPTFATHGHLYAAVIGPFRTKRGAAYMATYGKGNPHLQDVSDAENAARAQG